MEGITDIVIVGMDDKRPPRIRKEPYIDLYFKLSHQAPKDWCKTFNELLAKHPSTPKIKETEGLYIEAWVRTPDDIVALLTLLKKTVAECSRLYIRNIEALTRKTLNDNSSLANEAGEQGRLNRIIAALEFDKIEAQ